jgi:hypothetical protein
MNAFVAWTVEIEASCQFFHETVPRGAEHLLQSDALVRRISRDAVHAEPGNDNMGVFHRLRLQTPPNRFSSLAPFLPALRANLSAQGQWNA